MNWAEAGPGSNSAPPTVKLVPLLPCTGHSGFGPSALFLYGRRFGAHVLISHPVKTLAL